MIDIVYVVGKGFSEWRDNELRYSLRSIAKNGINVRKVVVVGHCPYWLNEDEVVCLPLKDATHDKHTNILTAVEYKRMVFTDDTVVRVIKDGNKIK